MESSELSSMEFQSDGGFLRGILPSVEFRVRKLKISGYLSGGVSSELVSLPFFFRTKIITRL